MTRKKYSPEQVVQFLRNIEIEQGRGATQEEAVKKSWNHFKLISDGANTTTQLERIVR